MRYLNTLRSLPFGLLLLATSMTSLAQGVSIGVSVNLAPPPLPVYVQPPVPGPGYLWAPGYWAWGPEGYYWVPGTWVVAPRPGYLWTPGYWGWERGAYFWHGGYWGPHVGFYGGVNYGFGYIGVGYEGGYWNHGAFFYNRAVTNIGTTHITNIYNKTVINNITVNRVSYNGGGGTSARPTAMELAATREQHIAVTDGQMQHERAAGSNHALLASVNHGAPAVAATPRPGQFSGAGIVRANRAAVARPQRDNALSGNRAGMNNGPRVAHPPAVTSMQPRNHAAPAPGNRPPPHNNPARRAGPQERERGGHPQ